MLRLKFLESILLDVTSKLSELQDRLAAAIDGMSVEDLRRHPKDKWSSAEILDHLNLTYRGTIKNCERCLASGKSGASPDRISKRWQRRGILWLGFFPPGRKSPVPVLPRGTPVSQLTTEIFENISRMESVISECDSRFGPGEPIAEHPILGPMTAGEWRKFHWVHGKHHARQIIRLRKSR
jgi:DinB superfamily